MSDEPRRSAARRCSTPAAPWPGCTREGYESIGILGTSLGSCLAMLTTAHEPLIKAAALNHISPYFADVVWDGLSTMHVRETLEGNVTLDELRRMWLPISPLPFLERMRGREVLLVYARYDLTFPVNLSRKLVRAFRDADVSHQLLVLPCGHYSTGVTPFKWMDGITLCRFLNRALRKQMIEAKVAVVGTVSCGRFESEPPLQVLENPA